MVTNFSFDHMTGENRDFELYLSNRQQVCMVYLSNRPQVSVGYLTIRLQARVFYEQIVNEAQPS